MLSNLFDQPLVTSFAMTAPSTHSICAANIIGEGQNRMAVIIRVIHQSNRKIAQRHLINCKNDDKKLMNDLLPTCNCHAQV